MYCLSNLSVVLSLFVLCCVGVSFVVLLLLCIVLFRWFCCCFGCSFFGRGVVLFVLSSCMFPMFVRCDLLWLFACVFLLLWLFCCVCLCLVVL